MVRKKLPPGYFADNKIKTDYDNRRAKEAEKNSKRRKELAEKGLRTNTNGDLECSLCQTPVIPTGNNNGKEIKCPECETVWFEEDKQ